MLVLLVLLLRFVGVSKIHCKVIPDNSTDVPALQDFRREITYDPTSVFNSWRSNISHCNWEGVKCSVTHPGRVVALELPGLRLAGQISSSVGNLTFLKKLDLSTNSLSGQLPPLNHLQRLHILNLTANSLQDVIPDSLINCSNLEILDLSHNLLAGEIPQRVDRLANLLKFRLSDNSLTGIIPPGIGNITSLELLGLAYNQLTGSIPDGLGKIPNISSLLLGGNSLSGGIPQGLFNQSTLFEIGLELNKLVGKPFPHNMGDALPNLWWLTLSDNMFEGVIPDSLGNASALEKLDLSRNSFSGTVPTSFGRLSKLSTLSLQSNKLEASDTQSWEFLSALGNCTSLQIFTMLDNQLQGQLPSSVGSLPAGLQQLFMSLNNLSGTVPPSIGNLKSLNTLGLTQNSFSGEIGEWIGNLKQLQGLYLGDNNFSGLIPSSIGSLNSLNKLYLENNEFEGPIPESLGNLMNLEDLDLSFNNLQGEIPHAIGNLKQLSELNIASNKLTGEIPINIGSLNSLFTLNLSHNSLSGAIPLALSDLVFLSVLDLSYNHLQGAVPINGVFAHSGNVSLGSNWGLCGGPMSQLHLPPCPTSSHRMHKRERLIKILIPVFGFMSLAMLVYFLLVEKKAATRDNSLSPSFGKTFQKVSYNDLAQATRNFSESNIIGRGSYGSVYRGKLKEPDMEVAVKVFDLEMRGAERSFMSECEALRSIQHRNLLPIITACSTVDSTGNVFKALIYEFMPNGSLDTWLHHTGEEKSQKSLGLTQRLNIAVNIADALNYVHHECGRTTVHCDLKPSNILLDDDMNALLGDFGIASFYVDSAATSTGSTSSVGLKGTIGYIAPGKRPTDPIFQDGLDIVSFVKSNFPHQIYNVIDHHLLEEYKDFDKSNMTSGDAFNQCSVSLLQVALRCAHSSPSERLNMKEIASKMHTIKTSYLSLKETKYASKE
ncbi:hypothetical protein HU200_039201 [Digitaria exilis]|uniref:Receptor kinase-like protein Xa21 n=1 Tax=Digitaria exilis TaxID=1010633 RepID=A0A835EG91_9POAL|nr:hypothetical protein HU200_039201 [Digitaria exilis]